MQKRKRKIYNDNSILSLACLGSPKKSAVLHLRSWKAIDSHHSHVD